MKNYQQIDISGDVGLRITGRSLEDIFTGAAEGLFNLITDSSGIQDTETRKISLCADSPESLLIQWLNELVFLFDTHGFVGKRFKLVFQRANVNVINVDAAAEDTDSSKLDAIVSGGIFDPDTHESRLLIKAATYHGLSIKKAHSRWEATVIFDI